MKRFLIIIIIIPLLTLEKGHGQEDPVQFTVKEAPEWGNLFKRDSGWFGGDGIFAIPLNGKENMENSDTVKNMFLFSDTMFGLIKGEKLQPGFTMVNNSIAILDGHEPKESKIQFRVLKDKEGNPVSLFRPQHPVNGPDEYFWLGDGFVNSVNKALLLRLLR